MVTQTQLLNTCVGDVEMTNKHRVDVVSKSDQLDSSEALEIAIGILTWSGCLNVG